MKANQFLKLVPEVQLFYKIEYKNCDCIDFGYTIVTNIKDIPNCVRAAHADLDDHESNAKIIITGIHMTEYQYNEWVKNNEP